MKKINTDQKPYADKKDLEQFGIVQSGLNNGASSAFKSGLDKIFTGKIIDNNFSQSVNDIENKKNELDLKVEALKDKNGDLLRKEEILEKIEKNGNEIVSTGQIPEQEKKLKEKKDLLNEIIENGDDKAKGHVQTFSLSKFIIFMFFFIPLSIYLIFFYTSITHNAFYGIDVTSLINGTKISLGIFPNFRDLMYALSENYMLIVAPFVFFGFGLAIHIFLEFESKLKYAAIISISVLTLLLDSFLAFKIHEETFKALMMIMNESQVETFIKPWNEDINFYIVLFMGFVVFIMWSIIFHAINKEWDKRKVVVNLEKVITRYKKEIERLKNKKAGYISHIKENQSKIDRFIKAKSELESNDYIKDGINKFASGWVKFLNIKLENYPDENETATLECEKIKIEFFANNFSKTDL